MLDAQKFVAGVRVAVGDAAVRSTIQTLKKPGKNPEPGAVLLSEWYKGLSESDQQSVELVIRKAVNYSVFNFLCVLDGVSTVEDAGPKGELHLNYIKDGKQVRLNDVRGEELHGLFS
jgi:hypothetical protein